MASSSAITLASRLISRAATGVPFPVDMDSIASVGAFPSEEGRRKQSDLASPFRRQALCNDLRGLLQDYLDGGGEPLQKA